MIGLNKFSEPIIEYYNRKSGLFCVLVFLFIVALIAGTLKTDAPAIEESNEVEIIATPISLEMYYCDGKGNEYKINPNAPNLAYFEARLEAIESRIKALEAIDYRTTEYILEKAIRSRSMTE